MFFKRFRKHILAKEPIPAAEPDKNDEQQEHPEQLPEELSERKSEQLPEKSSEPEENIKEPEIEVKFPLPNDISVPERARLVKSLSQTIKFSLYGLYNPKHDGLVETEKKAQIKAKNSQPD